ncbi:flippase [Crenobacter sp. SG2303]|uniref:Flippase n=1 Tax=Crenobacter oryzisoli TaxID=3056844 RepID=A0ABT7XSR3_9NEIS|nr:flippase [Crenobacter sp. SG2303]MDN0076848.1 flippase [Crenobacter sp. SG2303]
MSLIKNSAWNIAGFAIPSLIAIPAIGILARKLGVEKFGIFTLAYAIVGYASIFDAGLSRSVIRAVAMHRDDGEKLRNIVGTSLRVVFLLSTLAAAILWLSAAPLSSLLKIPNEISTDARSSFRVLALAIPAFLLGQVWLAYLEGTERFAELNIQKIATNSLIATLPALAILINNSLQASIIGLVVGRIIAALVSFAMCQRAMPKGQQNFDFQTLKSLIQFGSWVTISNIISPIMVYLDRFILSHILGSQRVAFYTAPSEAIMRMLAIPSAVARALFPKLSYQRNAHQHRRLYKNSLLGLLITCSAMAIPVCIFANEILTLWMGKDYAGEPAMVFRILLIGFISNSLAQIPFAKIQAQGQSRTTAALHAIEIIPYLLLMVFLIGKYATLGAATAWSVRLTVDFIALSWLASRIKP